MFYLYYFLQTDSPYTYIVQNTDQIELSQMKKCVPCNSCTDFIIKQPDAKEISVRIMGELDL